jgi:hypothetical protein
LDCFIDTAFRVYAIRWRSRRKSRRIKAFFNVHIRMRPHDQFHPAAESAATIYCAARNNENPVPKPIVIRKPIMYRQ